jgi:hypothetical protein
VTLLDDIAGLAKRERPCDVAVVLSRLSPDEVVALDAALTADVKAIPSTKIAAALRKNGHQITDDAVQAHRRAGGCSCPS